jgi:hypothetical protein
VVWITARAGTFWPQSARARGRGDGVGFRQPGGETGIWTSHVAGVGRGFMPTSSWAGRQPRGQIQSTRCCGHRRFPELVGGLPEGAQGKTSCLPKRDLRRKSDWSVYDECSGGSSPTQPGHRPPIRWREPSGGTSWTTIGMRRRDWGLREAAGWARHGRPRGPGGEWARDPATPGRQSTGSGSRRQHDPFAEGSWDGGVRFIRSVSIRIPEYL